MSEQQVILFVEDDPDDVKLTIRALKKANILNEVVVACNGVEALEYLDSIYSENTAFPALVLLDLKLPKIDGLEVLRRLRADERTRLLQVVVLTSSKEERDIIESYNLGANSYIRKPVDFDQFTKSVQELGLYWLVLNVAPPIKRKVK